MDSSPAVSVCIPTYQGGRFIAAAIDSVLAQSFGDFELLVVDDGSDDGTLDIVRAYRDQRLRFFHNERNVGAEGNWNRCLALAQGRYIKLLPQDDVLLPGCLEQQVGILERDAAAALSFVFSARQVIDPGGNRRMTRGYPRTGSGVVPASEIARRSMRRGTNLVGEPGAVLFRASLARKAGAFDGSNPYVIDLDYWFRLLAHGDAYYLAVPLCAFRLQPGAWTARIGKGQSAQFRDFMRRAAGWPRVTASALDRASGCVMAEVNMVLRRLLYFFLAR